MLKTKSVFFLCPPLHQDLHPGVRICIPGENRAKSVLEPSQEISLQAHESTFSIPTNVTAAELMAGLKNRGNRRIYIPH